MQGDREATLEVEAELGAPTAADDPAEGDQGDEDQDDQRAEAGPSEATAPHRARGAGTRWRAPVGWECRRMGCTRSPSQGCSASRSEEHTSELQSLMRISYAVFG